jgi:hypothetical protein
VNYFSSPSKTSNQSPEGPNKAFLGTSRRNDASGWDAPKETLLTKHLVRRDAGLEAPDEPPSTSSESRDVFANEAPPPPAQQQHLSPLQSSEETRGPSPTLVVPTSGETLKRSFPSEEESSSGKELPVKRARFEAVADFSEQLSASAESAAGSQHRPEAMLDSSYSSSDATAGFTSPRTATISSGDRTTTSRMRRYAAPPPRTRDLLETLELRGVDGRPRRQYRDPYFSNPADVPPRAWEYGGRSFILRDESVRSLPEFEHGAIDNVVRTAVSSAADVKRWEYAVPPPSLRETKAWLEQEHVPRTPLGKALFIPPRFLF